MLFPVPIKMESSESKSTLLLAIFNNNKNNTASTCVYGVKPPFGSRKFPLLTMHFQIRGWAGKSTTYWGGHSPRRRGDRSRRETLMIKPMLSQAYIQYGNACVESRAAPWRSRRGRQRRYWNCRGPEQQMTILAFLGGDGLKGRNPLFDFRVFALWTLKPLLVILGNLHRQRKLPVAFFAEELIGRHDNAPASFKAVADTSSSSPAGHES